MTQEMTVKTFAECRRLHSLGVIVAKSRTTNHPAQTDTSSQLLTLKDVARRLKLSRTTLWRMRTELNAFELRKGYIRVRESDLEAFINRRASDGTRIAPPRADGMVGTSGSGAA